MGEGDPWSDPLWGGHPLSNSEEKGGLGTFPGTGHCGAGKEGMGIGHPQWARRSFKAGGGEDQARPDQRPLFPPSPSFAHGWLSHLAFFGEGDAE